MFNKLKQIKDIRKQAKDMQSALAEILVVGKANGGKIMISMDGNQAIKGIQIEEGQSSKELEKGVQTAFEDCIKQLQKQMMLQMRDMGGLDGLKELLGGKE